MTATASVTPGSDPYVNGVLSGIKWGTTSLTYSFPGSASFYGAPYGGGEAGSNFKAFTATQIDATRAVLSLYSSYANLTFTEVTESATTHGELRYAESDMPGTAWAYYPSAAAEGGDAWFNNSRHYYDTPVRGNYAFETLLHETGHALGLKHPHEASGSFAALPVDHDSLEYTVMSYRSYIGASTTTGYTNGATSYPTTLMMYDIAAIQKMYGANYTTNAGDTVYSWNPTTGTMSLNGVAQAAPGGNKIFMTIWDGGGNDTYSFANYTTGVKVDLAPGSWTTASTTQLAQLGTGHVAAGNIANALLYNGNVASLIENAVGGSGADTLSGNQADNKLTGNGGNDTLDGRDGTDTALYSGASTSYSWVKNANGSWTVTDARGIDGVDTLFNIEKLQFTDKTVTIGTGTTSVVVTPPPPPVNTAPVASADYYTTARNTRLVVAATNGVLANDRDAEGNAMSAVLLTPPSKGSVVMSSNGAFTYTPASGWEGIVTFKYAASDGKLASTGTTVTIGIGAAASKTVALLKGAGAGAEAGHDDITEDQMPGETRTHTSTPLWTAEDSFFLPNRPGFTAGGHAGLGVDDGIGKILADLAHHGAPGGNLFASWTPDIIHVDHFII